MSGCYVVFHKQLGDLLLLEPALSRLRNHHGSPIVLLSRSGHEPLSKLMDGVQFQRRVPLVLRTHLYCFDPLYKSAWRSLLAPAKVKRCVLPDSSEMGWYHRPIFGDAIVPGLGNAYIAEYFWENVPVPAHGPFRSPRLAAPPEHWKPATVGDRPFVLLNPTSGWRQKNWRPECWAETLRRLDDKVGLRFLMTSSSTDWQIEHCRRIEELSGGLVTSLSSRTSLEHFLWLCSHAQLILTVDGSASHLAQAFGVRSLTLFGSTSLQNWHFETPRNRALQGGPSKKDGIGRMKNLSVDQVTEAALALLKPG